VADEVNRPERMLQRPGLAYVRLPILDVPTNWATRKNSIQSDVFSIEK
jgi:hypothetical protein